jgi:hypothetical protein
MADGERDSDGGVPVDDEFDEAVNEDPFVLFTEWASEADQRADAEFVPTPRAPR